tara:strand:+ start:7282 stop:8565 length:1284 start_codon:yes stop_codon:yes gene_type:complete
MFKQILKYLTFISTIIFLHFIFRSDFAGLISIVLVFFAVVLMCNIWRPVATILYTALAVRIAVMILGTYFVTLPDSWGDTDNFEKQAWIWSQGSFSDILSQNPGPDAYFFSWVSSFLYSLFGRSVLMLESISLLFSIGSVLLGWLLAKKFWDNRTAIKVCWILALFPSLVMYSGYFLRESYIYFFLTLAMLGIVGWIRTGDIKSIIITSVSFIACFYLNGVLILGFFVFLIIISLTVLKKFFKGIRRGNIHKKSFVVLFVTILFFGSYFANKFAIPKLGEYEKIIQPKLILERLLWNTRGDAAYPEWTIVKTLDELIYVAPYKIVNFMFGPLPWQVKKSAHWLGVFDSVACIFLFYLIICNRKNILKDEALKVMFLILLAYIVFFGIGVGNFGTGIRHRSKFIFFLLIFAGPFIPSISIFSKNKLKK